jgi:hypothetical protein
MHNQIVAHYLDGKLLKGVSNDFSPARPSFHLQDAETGEMTEVTLADLKAVYFVKSLSGDSEYKESQDGERPGYGRRIRVRFKDGEVLIGYTSGFAPNRPTFFVYPADPNSNNEKVLVITAATEEAGFV